VESADFAAFFATAAAVVVAVDVVVLVVVAVVVEVCVVTDDTVVVVVTEVAVKVALSVVMSLTFIVGGGSDVVSSTNVDEVDSVELKVANGVVCSGTQFELDAGTVPTANKG
jgi:hypothetical protein